MAARHTGPAGDGYDDVLVWRALGLVAGRPDVDRDDRALGLLIWAAYAVITNLTRKPGTPDSGNDARRILDQRLAKGEISPEEYQRLRDIIGSDSHHAATGAGGGQ